MSAPIVRGVLRHLLTIAGGYLVAQGTLTSGEMSEAVGAIVALAGIAWSIHEKRRPAAAHGCAHDRAPFTGAVVGIGIALITALVLGSGCASAERVTRADFEMRMGTNVVHVSQPKDTIIERLEVDPLTGKWSMHGYQSTANAAAIEATRAQANAQAQVLTRMIDFIDALSERAAVAYAGPGAAGAASRSKATSPPSVKVRDDPSKPWVQLDLAPTP